MVVVTVERGLGEFVAHAQMTDSAAADAQRLMVRRDFITPVFRNEELGRFLTPQVKLRANPTRRERSELP
jgi:hypothetical protein